MRYYKIQGGRHLKGSLTIQGSKNSVLPILAATLLTEEPCIIEHCPAISDVEATLEILTFLGCAVKREGSRVEVDSSPLNQTRIPEHLMRKMRSSVVFLGALLARMGCAELSLPGGCELGPRPIDLHLAALRGLGAEIQEQQGCLYCRCGEEGLRGREICFPTPSVGATENAMLCACGCSGVTTILGAAQEPEIVDLQRFLQAMGAEITGAGTSELRIQGGKPLHGVRFRVMGDRIAAATYLCAAAATQGELEVTGIEPGCLTAVLSALEDTGCQITTGEERISLVSRGLLRGIGPVRTAPYPGFPTDAQAILMAALAGGQGSTMFVENIFEARYGHVDELRRLGAEIQVSGRVAVVTGRRRLHGAQVYSTDLRGGAALLIAGLAAEGTTYVRSLHHIQRGYERLAETIRSLGGSIWELEDT